MKVVGLLVATVLALASTSALSLRSDSTVADSGAVDRPSGVDARSGDRSTASTRAEVADEGRERVDGQAVPAEPTGTLPPTGDLAASQEALAATGSVPTWANPGTDGALTISTYTWIDLGEAVPGTWDMNNSASAGKGVYDANKWAVVFKYSSVTMNSYWLQFVNHSSRAPIVWLVSGDVRIDGDLYVQGQDNQGCSNFAEGGPGGFRGGRGRTGTAYAAGGLGPGGGDQVLNTGVAAGSYATKGGTDALPQSPTYGNTYIVPLVGGSGGAAHYADGCYGGGGGGGAILIVAQGKITINGNIRAYGGIGSHNGGSGGSIRLMADWIAGAGNLWAHGRAPSYGDNTGGDGRIFVQANINDLSYPGNPQIISVPLDASAAIWPEDVQDSFPDIPEISGPPSIQATKLTIQDRESGLPVDRPVPGDPRANLASQQTDVSFDTEEPAIVHITANNVPLDWQVVVRVVPKSGDTFSVEAAPLVGTPGVSTTTAVLDLPRGIGGIQVRAHKPTP